MGYNYILMISNKYADLHLLLLVTFMEQEMIAKMATSVFVMMATLEIHVNTVNKPIQLFA